MQNVYLSPTLQTLITGVPRYVIMFVLLEQIPRSRAIRFVQSVFTLNQEQRALERCAKHLVWIPRYGIRAASIEMRHNISRYMDQWLSRDKTIHQRSKKDKKIEDNYVQFDSFQPVSIFLRK